MRTIFLNGEFLPEDQAKVSVFDHGLLYGDGVFEGIRIYNGRVFLLQDHLERLYDSAHAILLSIPIPLEEMREVVLESCRRNQLRDGYIRLVVTRGTGDLGLGPERCAKATFFCIASHIQLYPSECYEKGLKVITAATQQMNTAALSPSIKSLNYLNNIMAKVEGQLAGAGEAIMLNAQGYVAECSGDNIFLMKKGQIFTPPVHAGALAGITRRCAIDLIREAGKEVIEINLQRYDLFVADEIFLTGTGAEIIPVIEVDYRKIGTGKPGAFSQELIQRFRHFTQTNGVPF